jgi:hypothetical protein
LIYSISTQKLSCIEDGFYRLSTKKACHLPPLLDRRIPKSSLASACPLNESRIAHFWRRDRGYSQGRFGTDAVISFRKSRKRKKQAKPTKRQKMVVLNSSKQIQADISKATSDHKLRRAADMQKAGMMPAAQNQAFVCI